MSVPRPVRVLLLEDSDVDADLVGHRLRAGGLDAAIDRCDDEAGFRAALARGPDVVLADYSLPGFGGEAALRIVREADADLPFVFVTGVLGEETAVEMVRAGATDYVLKQRLARLPAAILRALEAAAERRSRREAERALRELEGWHDALVGGLREHAVIGLDPQGRIQSWNAAAGSIFGWSLDEVAGRHGELLFCGPPDARRRDACAELELARATGSASDDRWFARRDGSRLFGAGVTSAIRDGSGRLIGFSKIVRDATQARLDAQALRLAKERAETASRAKDRFIATLSHELRTPLAPVPFALRLIERGGPLTDAQRRALDTIARNVAVEIRLIDDLLDLSGIIHGKLQVERRPTDLREPVAAAVAICRPAAREAGATLVPRLADAPCWVDGDGARLQQVAWNLVRNAIAHDPGGTIDIGVGPAADGAVALTVRDRGRGIAPVDAERIFAAFEQAEGADPRPARGLGLGLAIARAIVEAHGGTLACESGGPGTGATFTATLPRVEPPPAADARADPGAVARLRPGREVLVIEDHADTLDILVSALDGSGWSVVVARTFADAVARLDGLREPALVSDLGLLDGSGHDVVRRFRERHAGPAIAVSGYGSEADVAASLDAGFDAHLVKPIDPDRLERLLAELDAARGAPG